MTDRPPALRDPGFDVLAWWRAVAPAPGDLAVPVAESVLASSAGDRTRRWLLGTEAAPTVVVKAFASHRGYSQEAYALDRWAPCLGGPTSLARDAQRLLVATRYLPGTCAAVEGYATDPRVYAAAGRAARVLHGIPAEDPDPRGVPESHAERRAVALERAGVEPSVAAACRAAWEACPLPRGPRVPCHRDHAPRNWIVTSLPHGPGESAVAVRLTDFEHARLDDALVDAVRLWLEVRPLTPHLYDAWRTACFATKEHSSLDDAVVRGLALVHALGTLAWARRAGDPALAATGRRWLAQELASAGSELEQPELEVSLDT